MGMKCSWYIDVAFMVVINPFESDFLLNLQFPNLVIFSSNKGFLELSICLSFYIKRKELKSLLLVRSAGRSLGE